MKIDLYDTSNIEAYKWPQTEEGELAKRYLLPLIREGTESYISNAKTKLYLLDVAGQIVPITVNETEYNNSYLLSSYFVAASLKEKLNEASWPIRITSMPLADLFGATLKWMKINKAVIINNWLFTTNLYPELTKSQMEAITAFLKERFPDHYLMFRSVNTYQDKSVYEGLNQNHYRMIPSRQIYLYDPKLTSKLSPSIRRKQKKDTNKLEKSSYEVETVETLTEEETSRLLELYGNVYLNKYTQYSPIYTAKYLQLMAPVLKFKLLKKNNKIYGVAAFLKKNNFLLIPFFGYDTTLPQEEGLYRMLSAIIMEEIEKQHIVSHQGSGAPDFKKWRGYVEQQEYVAIYDHHLPFHRRLFWTLGEKMSSLFNH